MTRAELVAAEAIEPDTAEQLALEQLALAASWPVVVEASGCRVSTGFLHGRRGRAYRSEVQLSATVDAVATMLADQMVECLPRWNREFLSGETLATLRSDPTDRIWVMRVVYGTPWPLANREYVYWLRRHDRRDDVVITYQSVAHPVAPGPGSVRATLSGTVHRLVAVPGGTRVEHLLAGDLGGAMPAWVQDHLVVQGVVRAQVRDAVAQQRMFA